MKLRKLFVDEGDLLEVVHSAKKAGDITIYQEEDLRAWLEAALSSEKKALAERNKECEKIKKDKNKILDDDKRAKLVYWTTYESGFNVGGALGMKAGKIDFARELLAELSDGGKE